MKDKIERSAIAESAVLADEEARGPAPISFHKPAYSVLRSVLRDSFKIAIAVEIGAGPEAGAEPNHSYPGTLEKQYKAIQTL